MYVTGVLVIAWITGVGKNENIFNPYDQTLQTLKTMFLKSI